MAYENFLPQPKVSVASIQLLNQTLSRSFFVREAWRDSDYRHWNLSLHRIASLWSKSDFTTMDLIELSRPRLGGVLTGI